MSDRYLVTGGAGFIGSHIVDELVRRGETVRVLDNLATGKRGNLADAWDQIEFIEGSLTDPATMQGVDYVLHQGALPSVPRSVADPATSHEVNVTGTVNVPIAARDAGVTRNSESLSKGAINTLERIPLADMQVVRTPCHGDRQSCKWNACLAVCPICALGCGLLMQPPLV